MSLTFNAFHQANCARCEANDGFAHSISQWTISDWMTATMGELGEAANLVKKLNRCRDGIKGNKEEESVLHAKLKREIGDTFVYLDLMSRACGFTIEEAARDAFNAKSDELGYTGKV